MLTIKSVKGNCIIMDGNHFESSFVRMNFELSNSYKTYILMTGSNGSITFHNEKTLIIGSNSIAGFRGLKIPEVVKRKVNINS